MPVVFGEKSDGKLSWGSSECLTNFNLVRTICFWEIASAPHMPRDDFSPSTRRILGERAAYICSNPDCRSNTIGPHSDPDRSLDTGVAAHICGAAPGGPRYDPTQTPEERKSIANGVWLCAKCSRVIDTDERIYPAERLRLWRSEHEQWISEQGMIPKLPDLRIEDVQGLSLPLGPGVITAEDSERIRERRLVLKNPNRVPVFQFGFRIQLPEPVTGCPKRSVPPGVAVQFAPLFPQFFASASGEGASVTVTRPPRPTPNASLKLDCLPPQAEVSFTIHTIVDWLNLPLSLAPEPEPEEAISLRHYISGEYFFEYRREQVRRRILVPLRYEGASRKIESLPPQSDNAPYSPMIYERFG